VAEQLKKTQEKRNRQNQKIFTTKMGQENTKKKEKQSHNRKGTEKSEKTRKHTQ
jgi:hypothetical protein